MRFVVLLFVIFTPSLLFAQASGEAREQLNSTMAAIKASGSRQKELDEKQSKLEHELTSLREETVDLAKASGKLEQALSTAEEKLAILEEQKRAKDKELSERRAELSTLISAMIKLEALPPEAIIAMPGKLDETFATARALGIVTHTIEEEAASLRAQLDEIRDLEDKIVKNRATILDEKSELAAKHAALNGKIRERGALEAELGNESEKEKEQLAFLETKSRSIQDLMDALGNGQQAAHYGRSAQAPLPKHARHGGHDIRSFATARGKLQPPAAGKIVRHYNDGGQESAFSRGITIETRENASVVTPFDGEVVYAGNFRDYGRIVIIRHSDDYHTLLSGMGHIDCTPGQFLMKGEPVGAMGGGSDARRLYMEVRKSGKPVDPLPWLRPVS